MASKDKDAQLQLNILIRERSEKILKRFGQMAVLGFNLNKLARELARRTEVALVG